MKGYKNISNCRICRSKEIETLFSLFEIPIPEVYEKNKKFELKKKKIPTNKSTTLPIDKEGVILAKARSIIMIVLKIFIIIFLA